MSPNMPKIIKAAYVTGPGRLEIREIDLPRVSEKDLLLKVEMCGVCGTDVHMFYSEKPYPWKKQEYPFMLGHEVVGRIEEVGGKFEGKDFFGQPIEVGDRVVPWPVIPCGECYFCKYIQQLNLCDFPPLKRKVPPLDGGFAEFQYIPKEKPIIKVPEDIPVEIAVLVEPFATALRAIERSFQPGVPDRCEGMGPGKIVVVQGSGPIGLLCTLLAKLSGASKVIVTGAPEARLKLCEEFGADTTINIEEVKDPKERIKLVKQETPSQAGADIVIEAAGKPQAFAEGLEMVRRGGTYVEIGHFTYQGEVSLNPQIIVHKDLRIIGSYGNTPQGFLTSLRILQQLKEKVPLQKIITHRFPLEKTKEALETARNLECVKAVIVP